MQVLVSGKILLCEIRTLAINAVVFDSKQPKSQEGLMIMQKHKLRILSILRENLRESRPQLVPSTTIAGQMNMDLPELQQVLKSMEGMGVIETDPDQQYNLITREGLVWFMLQSPQV